MASSSKGARRKRSARVYGQRGKKASLRTKTTVLILVQGEVTEKEYFKKLVDIRGWKASVSVTVAVCAEAPDIMAKQAEKRYNDYDRTFVVTDVDDFTPSQFETARSISRRAKNRERLKIVVTCPKFDLWLCAHHVQVKSNCDRAWVTKKEAELNILRPPRGANQQHRRKHIPENFPFEFTDIAIKNVNLAEYGYWSVQGSTSIPKMIEEIDALNGNT